MALFVALLVAPVASAQYQYPQNPATTFEQYKDYPQVRGETQPRTPQRHLSNIRITRRYAERRNR